MAIPIAGCRDRSPGRPMPKGFTRTSSRICSRNSICAASSAPMRMAVSTIGPSSPAATACRMTVRSASCLRQAGYPLRRPAHLHFMIKAPGFETITTHIYDGSDPHLAEDAIFGVKPELVARLRAAGQGRTVMAARPHLRHGARASGSRRHDRDFIYSGSPAHIVFGEGKSRCRRRMGRKARLQPGAGAVDAAAEGGCRGAGGAAGLARRRRLCRCRHAHAGRCHRSGDGGRGRDARPIASSRSAAARPPGSARRSPIAPTCRRSSSRPPMPARK